MKPILPIRIRNRRDLLQARQMVRQLTGMLGFDSAMQAKIACATFEVLCQDWQNNKPIKLILAIADQHFLVTTAPLLKAKPTQAADHPPTPRLKIPLPDDHSDNVSEAFWLVKQMRRKGTLDLFEEIHQQNQDMLRLLLKVKQLEEGGPLPIPPKSSASSA